MQAAIFSPSQQEQVLEYLKVLFGAAASCEDAAARHMIPICLCASKFEQCMIYLTCHLTSDP
jgi:hypothetical protein